MRLWSLHPRYLDSRGLVALWREGLLAQAVLRGQTRGYTRHPQLARFHAAPEPLAAIAAYLQAVHTESLRRGYTFDATKIIPAALAPETGAIPTTRGQIDYEWAHLLAKLASRAPADLAAIQSIADPEPHPLFRIVPGAVEPWEIVP